MKPIAIFLVGWICVSTCGLMTSASAEDAKSAQTIKDWGDVVDPDNDCDVREKNGKVTVTIPGTNHNLNPNRGMNAPRVLQKVKGDFTAQVRVTGEFQPGPLPAGAGRPFNGAGLLLWQNENNYLRLERNAFRYDPEMYCYPPLIEHWRNREYVGANDDPVDAKFFKGASTWLRMKRAGKDVTISISHDGKEWLEIKTIAVEFPDEVSVGVAAINQSNGPMIVDFDKFELMK